MAANDDLRAAWDEFCDGLKGAIDHVVDPEREVDDDERAEGIRHMLRTLGRQVEETFENDDPLHPELGWSYPSKMGQDNPDGLYQTAPMDLQYTYRLSGNVGTVRSLGCSIMTWTFGTAPIRQLVELDGADLVVDENGEFEVFFSPDPAPVDAATGTWHQLEPVVTRMLLRQFFADWTNERPAELHLECMSADAPPPRLTPTTVIDKLQRVGAMTNLMGNYWTGFAEVHMHEGEINRFAPPLSDGQTQNLGGTERQAYNQCMWRVGPDEALVLSFTPPRCFYWEVQLGDRWYQSLDYVNRPVTLNDAQADVDADGVVRIVIAGEDPGIVNWLDTAGGTDGYLTLRFNLAESRPVPEIEMVAFADIDRHLSADTPRIGRAARAELDRVRRRGALTRFRR